MTLPVNIKESRILRLDVIEEENFRMNSGVRLEDDKNWNVIRREALLRDNYTCYYCGFHYHEYMEVHHKDGIWQDSGQNNLITLCPLCHSCLHIGLAGLQYRGVLLSLKNSCDQAKLNRLILDTVKQYKEKAQKAVAEIYQNLPIQRDLDSNGLVVLANKIQEEKKNRKKQARQVSDTFIFFPDITKFNIVRSMIEKHVE